MSRLLEIISALQELTFLLSKITSGIAVFAFICMVLVSDFFYRRLDKPTYLNYLRNTCYGIFLSIILFLISLSIQLFALFVQPRFYTPNSTSFTISEWVAALLFIAIYIKYYRGFLTERDNNIILAGYYIKKHITLSKKKDHSNAYEYLLKASELQPNSLFIWCKLAEFSILFLQDIGLSEKYFEKAKLVLESSKEIKTEDQAILEYCRGKLIQYRDNYQTDQIK